MFIPSQHLVDFELPSGSEMSLNLDSDDSILGQMTLSLEVSVKQAIQNNMYYKLRQ